MEKATLERLKAAGYWSGDAGDFLGLTEEERQLVDLHVQVSHAVRRRREQGGLTRQQLAEKIQSSQSRVAKVESGVVGVSLDLAFRALFALGGTMADLADRQKPKATPGKPRKNRQASR